MPRISLALLVALLLSLAAPFLTASPERASAQTASDPRFFPQTGFRIDNDAFWTYFRARGGLSTFGFPVSRAFTLNGSPVQIFQRRVVQLNRDGSVGQLNLLDPGLLPFTSFNRAVVPAIDPALVATVPVVGSPNYAAAVLDYVRRNAPDTFNGRSVNFFSTFQNTVPLEVAFPNGGGDPTLLPGFDLEMWGVPTSAPAPDPANPNFIYQRWQRGIMHFDAGCNCTQGLLLGDYFKAIITGGQNLPADLAQEAATSPFFRQYDRTKPNGLARPTALPNTNMISAFEADAPRPPPPSGKNGLRYGFGSWGFFQDQSKIASSTKNAGFGWIKQQIRWADMEPTPGHIRFDLIDPIVDQTSAAGLGVLFSIVTAPTWARADGRTNGPPDNLADFANFVGALAERYDGKVQAFEIWNEQNFSREWGGGAINAGAYVELLRAAHDRIKSIDPNIIVVSGALTPTGVNDVNIAVDDTLYLDQMYQYKNGLFLSIADAVGAHSAGYNNAPGDYVGQNSLLVPCHDNLGNLLGTTNCFKNNGQFYFRRIDDLQAIAARNRDGRPFWITEYEWGSATPPIPAGYEWTLDLSEAQVGDFYVQGIQSIQQSRPWVGAVFVWNLNWRTFADFHKDESALFGVLNPDFSPRSIYQKLAQMPK